MKKLTRITIRTIMLSLLFLPAFAQQAQAAGTVLIVELQTGSASSANAEFVRLANVSTAALDLSGWKLQYKSAAGSSWTTKSVLQSSLSAGSSLLVATSSYATTEAHQTMSDGLAQAGGHIQVVDGSGYVSDLLGWGTAAHPEGSAAQSPAPDEILSRKSSTGIYADGDNNAVDFSVAAPSVSPPQPGNNDNGPVDSGSLNQPIITELLPNPAAPQTDENDEYVELYNPNSTGFALKGYKLQTGSKYSYSLSFDDQVLAPGTYVIFTSGATPLTLSNTAGGARLLDSTGTVVDETAPYDSAGEGAAWARIGDTWQWTSTPTPNAANVLVATEANGSATSSAKVAGASTKTKTAKVKAVKAAKKTKAKTKKAAKATTTGTDTFADDTSKTASPLHPMILAGVGTLAVVYGVYEYRHDLANAFYKLRRYRATRRETRKTT